MTSVLEWEKDTKTKTCKCKVCGERVKHFSHKCRSCGVRVCSECSEVDGQRTKAHQAMANDFLVVGCWCGYPSKFNSAFEGKIPSHKPKPTVAKGPSGKRKREATPLAGPSNAPAAVPGTKPPIKGTDDPFLELHVLVEAAPPPKKRTRRERGKPESAPEKQTIVVGAGIIGLFVAYELAKKTKGTKHTITVVDINEKPCQLASRYSAGLINVHGMRDSWNPLLEAATTAWTELRETDDFNKAVHFSSSVYTTANTGSDDEEEDIPAIFPPAWFKSNAETQQDLISDTEGFRSTLGRVSVPNLTDFLYTQGVKLGVKFRFGMHPYAIEYNRGWQVRGLCIKSPDILPPTKTIALPCTDIIIAAGVFTTKVLSAILPENTLDLHNNCQKIDWLTLRSAPVSASTAIIVPEDDEKDSAQITITASRSNQTITLFTPAVPSTTSLNPRQGEALSPKPTPRCLLPNPTLTKHLSLPKHPVTVAQGSTLISTANNENPVLGKMPPEEVGLGCNVWVCYGFGNHGTTLAPGVGKLMAQMVLGQETSEDMYDFTVTELKRPSLPVKMLMSKGIEAQGKGKGKMPV